MMAESRRIELHGDRTVPIAWTLIPPVRQLHKTTNRMVPETC